MPETSVIVGIVLSATIGSFGVLSAIHALLNKRDPRSQLGWTVLCVMLPAVGAVAYWLLGVNRIRTRAKKWQAAGLFEVGPLDVRNISSANPVRAEQMGALLALSRNVTGRPLIAGSKVRALHDGEQAYPEMLAAIRGARRWVHLCTYIFESDRVGREFAEALGEAAARGVDVRVLIDAIGDRYARPRATRLLKTYPGIKIARFLPLALSLRGLRVNLRNHRKILTVDGETGFTGGMNIGGRHLTADAGNRHKTVDLHFRVDGPGVAFLEESFYADWRFTTGGGTQWPGYDPLPAPRGTALCRGITDGPNEDFERLQLILIGAISCAHERIRVMTPYFIPSRELVGAFAGAALRGVQVELILPARSNLRFVDWASTAMLSEVVQHGVRVYRRPTPFAHSKLFMVDDYYLNIGSANLDPRSLRLNFEFNLELFSSELGASLAAHFDEVRDRSSLVTLDDLNSRGIFTQLRDALAKVFAPYL